MPSPASSFSGACALVGSAIDGAARHRLVADFARSQPFGRALGRLREHLRANSFDVFLSAFDHRTQQEGFHALHDWDGKADRVLGDTIPVDVLDYVARLRGDHETSPRAIAILLDYYYLHVLSLLALRAWDEGDADANLDRVDRLLATLQGSGGSGQPFAADAETLILIATSHYERVERGYDRLLRRVRALNREHQLKVALGHASSMGCHLRFGFEATYRRDTAAMRDDNIADYPWLCYALATLMREYLAPDADDDRRAAIVEAMANGLSADARAFVGAPPALLAAAEVERAEFRGAFLAHRDEFVAALERCRPIEGFYSPLSFFFNFSHNVLKGTVVDAALRGEPWPVSFNDLLRRARVTVRPAARDDADIARERLARTLMDYARANPDRINGELTAVIAYDPRAGHRAFRVMMEKLTEEPRSAPSP
jgi:hypothetical protein